MPAAPWTCSVFRGVDVSARKTMKDASKKQPSFSSVAIAGPGLLGGSLALAVRARMPHVHVRLWGRRPEPLEYALSIGAAHADSTRVEEVVQGADLVVLATPVGVMPDIVTAMLPALKPGAVVTDVGSVKGCVHQSVGAALTRAGVAFIGSHPMAGSEKQGMEHASAELFQGATCILTNDEHVHEDVLLLLQRFWERAGCHCIRMQAAVHDSTVARISHIPHALSALCVHSALDGGDVELLGLVSAGGFRDTTRVSMGEPSMWAEILTENSPAVLERLDAALSQLGDVRKFLADGDKKSLAEWLKKAGESRAQALGL